MAMPIKEAIAKLLAGEDLSESEAEEVMGQIMQGQATPAQIGGFLIALRMKGETVGEITGCARAMRASAIRVQPKRTDLVDTCGTGGDGAGSFNISTTTAFVVAGAGLGVAKHGNRSVSSQAGSADLLEALGVNIELTPEEIADCIDQVGLGFLFAPRLHPAMKYAIGPRREMGVRTIFNILGPLTNPAFVSRQIIGIYDPALTETLAGVLGRLGSRAAMVFHGAHGLDELSTTGPNTVCFLRDGGIHTLPVDGIELGLPRSTLAELKGGSAEENAAITESILAGEKGPRRDVVLLNAAAALLVGGLAEDWQQGVEMARQSIDSGDAAKVLDNLREYTHSLGGPS